MKRCKHCKEKFTPMYSSLERVCKRQECKAREYSSAKPSAYCSKKSKPIKSTLKKTKESARIACHLYIRERDIGKLCPCCNKPLGEDYHAGHFIPSANNPKIRYDEDNIHGQRASCNLFEDGDSGDYEKNLRVRIGDERVDRLLENKGGVVKRTIEDYNIIEKYFKEKLRVLREG